jgi:hypothetical protein
MRHRQHTHPSHAPQHKAATHTSAPLPLWLVTWGPQPHTAQRTAILAATLSARLASPSLHTAQQPASLAAALSARWQDWVVPQLHSDNTSNGSLHHAEHQLVQHCVLLVNDMCVR